MSKDRLPLLPLVLEGVPPGLTRALAQEGIPFCYAGEAMPRGRFVLFDSRSGPPPLLAYGQSAVDVDRLRDLRDGDPMETLMQQRAQRHCWQIAGLVVTEEVSLVDRWAVRQRLLAGLREQVEQAGGAWLRVAAFPFPYRSALNFRIDYDQYDPHDFDATLAAIAGNEHATSHFVSGAAYQPHAEALARLRGLEVGSHGYRHHTYPGERENFGNVSRGIEMLRTGGIEPCGFAAPGGRFNGGLLAALEALQVGHSSEFGLAYDELPFFPGAGDLLQIPVHPVCLGSLLETAKGEGPRREAARRQAAAAAADHFRRTAQEKYNSGQPVFLYGHPTGRLGRFPNVLRAVFETAERFGAIWKTTLGEFADWWRARERVRINVFRRGDDFTVTADRLPAGYAVGIEYLRGRHVARMPLKHGSIQFSASALAYENRAAPSRVRPVRVDRSEGLRGRIRRIIDWERETPIEEIVADNWRNWAKRTLRQWRP